MIAKVSGRNTLFLILAGLALSLAGAAAAMPALANPPDPGLNAKQSEVEQVKNEVAAINLASEQAVERYDEANSKLQATEQQITQNQKSLDDAKARLTEAQARLARRLDSIYRDGSLSVLDVIMNTGSFSDLMSRLDLLGRIGDQDRADIKAVMDYKARVQSMQAGLEATMRQQQDLLNDIAAQKSQIEAQLAARQAVLASAQAQVAQMVTQQMQAGQVATAPVPAAASAPGSQHASGSPQSTGGGSPVASPQTPPAEGGGVVAIAERYLGVPYVWGGASPSGFDCSGLVMYVYAQVGVRLPHSAAAQYAAGTPISFSQLEPGDLVFFGHPISHVGIYVGGGSMINAPYPGASVSITSVGNGGSYAGACRI